jgi:hypothetical protein
MRIGMRIRRARPDSSGRQPGVRAIAGPWPLTPVEPGVTCQPGVPWQTAMGSAALVLVGASVASLLGAGFVLDLAPAGIEPATPSLPWIGD